MNQALLHEIAKRNGFIVALFSDHPDFFSSWSLRVTKSNTTYMIDNDGRNEWLILYKETSPNKYQELDKKTSHTMNNNEKANICEIWLQTISN
ncbi:hypothetical protein HU755_26740 [Pseudomonas sp. SWRI111]|uniref:hypothetical protein n=1 Tax=Pseudomonas sp. SWRI111 TaxID=2745507 RepID=UPI0016492FE7|nr:hypothetical protein [Pseudomonas sp. SWRI111]MBC3210407.1 hypothetical protein [Pseudomonas sp. SWRI111]